MARVGEGDVVQCGVTITGAEKAGWFSPDSGFLNDCEGMQPKCVLRELP